MSSLPARRRASSDLAEASQGVPALISAAGQAAGERFIEYFTANIRNKNTRAAYHRCVSNFFDWCELRKLAALSSIKPVHVAAFVEELGKTHSPPSVKQHLAAVRMLFDFLVVGQVMATNPAHSVRGPKHVVTKGKTVVLSPEEARQLLDSIDVTHVVGLRDRAVIATMLYTFGRVEATMRMNIEDYYPSGKPWWVRLREKGGKAHEMPAHHRLEEYMDAYLAMAGVDGDKKTPLFRTAAGKTKKLTANRMTRNDAWRMIRRRASDAGIKTAAGCHSFRATGITNYLENGGTLEKAQQMAAHSSARTTKLYDRRDDQVSLDEIERIAI